MLSCSLLVWFGLLKEGRYLMSCHSAMDIILTRMGGEQETDLLESGPGVDLIEFLVLILVLVYCIMESYEAKAIRISEARR